MRMWGTDVTKMCNPHLLGEHRELHMIVGALRSKKMTLWGHLRAGLIDVRLIAPRHEEIVQEFRRRGLPSGFWHDTPLRPEDVPECRHDYAPGFLDIEVNEQTLRERGCKCQY